MSVLQEQPQQNTTFGVVPPSVPKGIGDTSRAVEALWHRSYASFTGMLSLRSYKPPYVVGHVMPEQLASTRAKINALLNWEDGWNGYDASAPSLPAIRHAHVWIELLHQTVVASNQRWIDPNVTVDASGEVVFGWWNGKKELSIYITAGAAEYIQVWGPSIVSDMSEGDAEPLLARHTLWQWLITA